MDDRLKNLKDYFDSRSVNKSQFEREVREKGYTFSRVSLNNVLSGKTALTRKFWAKLNSVLEWE